MKKFVYMAVATSMILIHSNLQAGGYSQADSKNVERDLKILVGGIFCTGFVVGIGATFLALKLSRK